MALKLTIGKGDKIIMSDGVVIDLIHIGAKNSGQVTLAFEAPQEIRINAIFQDSRKQFKRLKGERDGNRH